MNSAPITFTLYIQAFIMMSFQVDFTFKDCFLFVGIANDSTEESLLADSIF